MEEGKYYHVYNRGNNSQPIFFEEENFTYFLKLLSKYIYPVASVYSYCLLKNHFHILLSTKTEDEINRDDLSYSTVKMSKKVTCTSQFSHFFNAYTQAVNKRYKRTGSIFEKHFKFKEIDTENYFLTSVLYIHNNPVKHGICKKLEEYHWSSFNPILNLSNKNTDFAKVIEMFGGKENFIFSHQQKIE